jgi:hypothetical protein
MGDAVYFRRGGEVVASIMAQRIGSGENRVVVPESEDYLQLEAAAGGRLFTSINERDGPYNAVHVRDTAGAVVDEYSRNDSLTLRTVGQRWTTGAAPRVFDGERYLVRGGSSDITLLGVSTGVLGVAELETWFHMLRTRPVLTDNGFAYTAAAVKEGVIEPIQERDYLAADVFVFEPGSGRRQVTDTPRNERYVFADDGVLYWIDEEGVYAKKGDEPAEQIYQGRCGAPHASGGKAVFACAGPNDGTQPNGEPVTSRLLLYDGANVREIANSGDTATIHSPRVFNAGIAWVEFGIGERSCREGATSLVMLYDFATRRPRDLGGGSTDIWCVGAGTSLSLSDRVLAWNMTTLQSPTGASQKTQAYAVIAPHRCCEN